MRGADVEREEVGLDEDSGMGDLGKKPLSVGQEEREWALGSSGVKLVPGVGREDIVGMRGTVAVNLAKARGVVRRRTLGSLQRAEKRLAE